MSTTTDTPASDEAGSQDAAKETGFEFDVTRFELGMYNGVPLPYNVEPLEVYVPKVMNMSLRDTDIVLLTYPKSGTHWVWRVLDMLAMGSAVYSDRRMISSMLDVVPVDVIDKVSTDVRRVIHTHYPSDFLPTQLKDGRVKVVHMYRNPKATLVSWMHHIRGLYGPDLTLDLFEAKLYDNTCVYKNQFHYFDKLMEYERNNPNVDIFHLAYEDMKKDAVGCIKKLAAHLNVDASDELCTGIEKALCLSTQKKKEGVLPESRQGQVEIFRKGEVNDWKNYFTVAQSERMDKVLADRAASCQFSRRYCPTVTTDQGHVYRLASSS